MIGTRLAASLVAVVGLAVLVAPRAPDPGVQLAAEALVRARAEAATQELDELRGALAVAVDAARGASTAILSGEGSPAVSIERAADAIAAVVPQAGVTRQAVRRLNGALAASRDDAAQVSQPFAEGDLGSIADQLRATQPAAAEFVTLRDRAGRLPDELEAALGDLDAGDIAAAEGHLAEARATHELAAGWEAAPTTLGVWLETTDAMIRAVDDLIAAVRDGDADLAIAAADRFAALGTDADAADRALRIALSEGGAAVTAAPLGRLAEAARGADEARAAAAAIARGDAP
jgi:hypothetical protein